MSVVRFSLSDGRVLGYELFGDEGGRPVYFFHGFPGSRLQAELVADQARDHGLCLVAFDRPGFGESSPYPTRTIPGIAADVAELADHLKHVRFGVLGTSCGGAYALAVAAALPERVLHVGLLAGIGPMDVPGIRDTQLAPLKLLFFLARLHPSLVTPMLGLDSLLFRRNPAKAVESLAKLLSKPDQEMLAAHPDTASIFGRGLAEAYRQGIDGVKVEAHLIAMPRGYRLEDIAVPVDIFQSGFDRHVPPAMGMYLAEHIPHSRYHFLEQEGHLSIFINAFGQYAGAFSKFAAK